MIAEPLTTTVLVDWTRGELRPRPAKPTRRETYYPVYCATCDTARWLRRGDALKARECGRCQRRAAGRLGYAATAEKYGPHFAAKQFRDWRLDNPSSYEQIVIKQLAQLGLQADDYEREFWLEDGDGGVYFVDFMICWQHGIFAVEVGADYWHTGREAADAAKAATLKYNTIPLLTLTDDDVLSGQCFDLLATFLGVSGAGR